MNEISKSQQVKAVSAYSNTNDVTKTERVKGTEATNYCFTEVSYRNGQARLVVEPIPNPYGERHMLCLNPLEAYMLVTKTSTGRYTLPSPEIERGSYD